MTRHRDPIPYALTGRRLRAVPNPPTSPALHALDHENSVGGSRYGARLHDIRYRYYARGLVRSGDHFIGATGPTLAAEARFAWPMGILRIGHGLNGADHALLNEVIDIQRLATRYSTIYISSGDQIFAGPAQDLRDAGLHVVAVVAYGGLSATMARAVDEVVDLLDSRHPFPAAAEHAA